MQLAHAATDNHHATVAREHLIFDRAMLEEVTAEITQAMAGERQEQARALQASDPVAWNGVVKFTCDMATLLAVAKAFEDEADFEGAVGFIAQADFRAHNGLLADFGRAMLDIEDRSLARVDSHLFECLPAECVSRRLDQIRQFITHQAGN